uniref:Uncharacterized protein n=1 Tax=Romanomermis culicivorax TaxID=13658 RepID=A0A915KR09_ROMCU
MNFGLWSEARLGHHLPKFCNVSGFKSLTPQTYKPLVTSVNLANLGLTLKTGIITEQIFAG